MIEVRTCARLHLGLLDNNGEHGRLYGSIGLAVDQPSLVLRAEKSESLIIEGMETERVSIYAQRFIDRYGVPAGACLNLLTGIPAHVGLGSGTQIALAVGTALARLAGLDLSTEEIALAGGRGVRSGIGIATFQHGGFVLDGGHRVLQKPDSSSETQATQIEKDRVPPILFRHPVPKDWHFVTVIPGNAQGFSGENENSAFLHLPKTGPQLVEKVSWLLLMKMLPSLVETDIAGFGQALTGIQRMIGDCFASVQDGSFSNPVSGKLIEFLLEKGAAGAGQSSWGPAVYGLVKGNESARRLKKEVQAFLAGLGGGQAFCVRPRNRGAVIKNIEGTAGLGVNIHAEVRERGE
jgi:beta-ribofuranosylaminobenzene 5'-phosphate synthase